MSWTALCHTMGDKVTGIKIVCLFYCKKNEEWKSWKGP
jgi:hypothetical protein